MNTQITSFAPLLKERYVSLTTFRKNGAAVATPVWFVESNGTLYIGTDAAAGKVKRIRNSGRVTLAPCTASGKILGPHVEGRASMVSDPEESARALALLARKYGTQFRLIGFFQGLTRLVRHRPDTFIFLAIVP